MTEQKKIKFRNFKVFKKDKDQDIFVSTFSYTHFSNTHFLNCVNIAFTERYK